MKLQITARHFTASPNLKSYTENKLIKLERFYDGITDALVTFEKVGKPGTCTAEVTMGVHKQRLSAAADASTHELALDEAVDRMRKQLLRYKSKIRDITKDAHR